jgi:hypothetical protein
MFHRFGFRYLGRFAVQSPINTYEFDNDNQAVYCPFDIKLIIKSRNCKDQTSNYINIGVEKIFEENIRNSNNK